MYYNVCGKFKSKLSLSRVHCSATTQYIYIYTYSRKHILITKTDKILNKLGRLQSADIFVYYNLDLVQIKKN